MIEWFLQHFVINSGTIAMLFVFSVVVIYESRTKKPITLFFGENSGLFTGNKNQKIKKWIIFLVICFFLIWNL